jgi:hypothetical protein
MEAKQFDLVAKAVGQGTARRRLLAGLLGAALAAPLGRAAADNVCKPLGKKCNKDAQCCPGSKCVDGTCQPCGRGNTTCTQNADCCSGACTGQGCCPVCPAGCRCALGIVGLVCITGDITGPCDSSLPNECPEGEICGMNEQCFKACEPLA